MTGTLINTLAVLAGGAIGLLLRNRLPDRYVTIFFQAIGLFTLYLGISLALKAEQVFWVVMALIIGGVVGEALNLEQRIENAGNHLKGRLRQGNEKFTEGLLTAFLLYCMGSMTIVGAVNEGLGMGYDILLIKSLMDGISSIALASALGVGVLFSAIPLFLYQGGLTLFSSAMGDMIPPALITDISAVGGILLIGLAINILDIKKIRVMNLVPALIILPVLWYLFPAL